MLEDRAALIRGAFLKEALDFIGWAHSLSFFFGRPAWSGA
jgi:hypothetical protein